MRRPLPRLQTDVCRHAKLVAVCFVLTLASRDTLSAQVAGASHTSSAHLDSLRRFYRVPPAQVRPILVATFLGAPGSSLGSPAATGVGSDNYFIGAGFQQRTRFTDRPDAGFGGGIGFGDPESSVGLELTVSSFSSVRHPPASIGGVSFKFHHRDPQHRMLYAVGMENAATWGAADGGHSVYGVISRVFVPRERENASLGVVSVSLGIGNGRFRTASEIDNHRKTVGVFGGAGVRITPAIALVSDWTGQDLDAGLSVTPFPGRGLVGLIGFADLTHSAGNGARFIMAIGYGFNSRRDNRRLSPEDLNAVFMPR